MAELDTSKMTYDEMVDTLRGIVFGAFVRTTVRKREREALDMAIKVLEQENNSLHCQYADTEIAKSFIEDVETVKDQLPCGEQMDFPNTFDEFAKLYSFKDRDEIYTNGSELIPVFRVKQWLEHILATKNDSGVDCIKGRVDE